MEKPKVGLVVFFLMWARIQKWDVPLLHIRICMWLESCLSPVRVLMVFRGAGKSTIYAVYKAWKLYKDPTKVSLIWAADGPLSKKLTRDTINILRRHPLCGGMLPPKPGAQMFWVNGHTDSRNASMTAVGVNQNVTSARAHDIDYDDIEVPKNIKTPEARENLRNKIQEATSILVPGGQETLVGTPHTTDSIYPETIEAGAESLKIPLFESAVRYRETTKTTRFRFYFTPGDDGLYVILGIHKHARVCKEGVDYRIEGNEVVFNTPPCMVLDIYAHCAWPERFSREDIANRRKKARTLNYWDSQYQLEAKPITDVRLDPERMLAYDMMPVTKMINRQAVMMLGNVQIVGAVARWDCALGKTKSDSSAFCLILTDARGKLYWQFAIGLTGDLDAQCKTIRELVLQYQIPSVTVETNGPGGFVPPILRGHLKGIENCAVLEDFAHTNKNKDILDGLEPPLSNQFLWAHVSVFDSPAYAEMRDFNPGITEQPDGFIDAAARAIKQTPVRIGNFVGIPTDHQRDNWRPNSGVYEVTVEH